MSSTRVIFNNGLIFVPAINYFAYAEQFIGQLQEDFVILSGTKIVSDEMKIDVVNQLLDLRQKSVNTSDYKSASIILSTSCAGECTYCYATDTRHLHYKLSRTALADLLPKDVHRVIVYGGEPLLDVAYFINTVLATVPVGCDVFAVTGLLYGEDTFAKVFALMDVYPTLRLSLSIDPKPVYGEYTRRYLKQSAYEMLVRRVGQLVDAYPMRVGLSCTITDNCYDLLGLVADIRKFTPSTLYFNACPADDGVATAVIQSIINQLSNLPADVVVNDGRGKYDPLTNELGFLRPFGKCHYMCGARPAVCVNVDGYHCGCNQAITGEHEHSKLRASVWDKCKECDFLGVCGGYCYLKCPAESSCTWSVYNAMMRIWLSFKDLPTEELKAAITAANSHVRVEPYNTS